MIRGGGVHIFSSYNLKPFGLQLKKLRDTNGYSQTDVQSLCGINPDTLRRLENGYTIPKYETLELLSQVYKVDLLNILRRYRSNEGLYTYYERLDLLISRYNIEVLKDLEKDFKIYMDSSGKDLVNQSLYHQFKLLLLGIRQYNQEDNKEKVKSLNTFIEALKYSIKDFHVDLYQQFKYNVFEIRILLLVALGLSLHEQYELSNSYLNFILLDIAQISPVDMQISMLVIKVYVQLSYNSHYLSDDLKTLEYANKGIQYSVDNNIMYALFLLYYRKGIAEFMLKNDNYMDSLHKSIQLLEIQNNHDLAQLYKDITYKMYGLLIK